MFWKKKNPNQSSVVIKDHVGLRWMVVSDEQVVNQNQKIGPLSIISQQGIQGQHETIMTMSEK